MFIYEDKNWPQFFWDSEKLLHLISEVRNYQGQLIGKMGTLGFDLKNQANLEVLSLDVIKSTEIEGEKLNKDKVRSSIAKRLGIEISGLTDSDRHIDGVVEMLLDATGNSEKLSAERLFGWHNSLFPTGYSGLRKINTARWRDDSKGPMEVVSGPIGKEKVHFQAPKAEHLDKEMERFINWINSENEIDLVLKAAIAHLWFVTLHPFDDGNGRIARALTDMMLAKSDKQPYRFYSISTQIRKERKKYYEILEKTQKGNLDITKWLEWFLNCLLNALKASEIILGKVIFKHNFWLQNDGKIINERQRKILNMLLDGFKGNINTSKWASICKCSQDTALRDIQDLIKKGILHKLPHGGRSTSYSINNF